ncbi:hypothetical protein AVEN_105225-1 [Araneus ventricosus]|uniref:Uncharacterized protein n=1 Tax=Araneus ventricosus TaxID=182803 RepID=A0A4Y2JM35_ARAVE|nr:hypothetical protein AVEN_105225-1 [Araneus ventricosus]
MVLNLNQDIARSAVAVVNKEFLNTYKFLIHFLTNHGPFPCYLHRLKKKLGSPLSVCGVVGDADHHVFWCPLTAEFHLKEQSEEHRTSWFNGQAQSKLIHILLKSEMTFTTG